MDTDTGQDHDSSQGHPVTTSGYNIPASSQHPVASDSSTSHNSRVTWSDQHRTPGLSETTTTTTTDPTRLHRDSGYLTESQTSTPHFFLGDQGSTQFTFETDPPTSSWDDLANNSDNSDAEEESGSVFHPSTTTQPIHIPRPDQGEGFMSLRFTHFTPPRAYQMRPHLSSSSLSYVGASSHHHDNPNPARRDLSTQIPAVSQPGAVMGSVLRQQNQSFGRTTLRPPTVRQRTRHYSTAVLPDHTGLQEMPYRDRSNSAPCILTPQQRYCANELRRISDEFDREYHGLNDVYRVNHNNSSRPSSYPGTRVSASWWQNVVRFFSPQNVRQRRPPPSPIRETESHLEEAAMATSSVTDSEPHSEAVAMETTDNQSDYDEVDSLMATS